MSATIVILSLLFFTSTIMCLTMTLAWQHFGRERYVLFWAMSYGVSVLQWVFNTLGVTLKSPPMMFLAAACIIVSSSLVPIGARQRARQPIRWGQFMLGGGIAMIGCAIAYSPIGTRAMQGTIASGYTAVMIAAAAAAIWPRGRAFKAPERAYFWVLVLFALFQIVLVGVGSTLRDGTGESGLAVYRAVLAIGLPAVYLAAGVTAIVLIAGDLSAQLRMLVSFDQLTGLLNRRGMEEAGARAVAHALRQDRRLAAVICDMDRFKAVNDSHGHMTGDAALRAFSRVLLGAIRKEDIAARLGGDEFCVLLVDASEHDAADVMERVRAGLEQLAIDRMLTGSISASFGVTALQSGDRGLDDLIHRADHALYMSKQRGRNRVTVWNSAIGAPSAAPLDPLAAVA
ncbi:GGDEF domain-containing protein [Sphingobium algorifonticola]|uniref:diguanylate cyclase n=1 Tax=Sphingobium algorifonticola TaxID=2008318 RepID=A0A437J7A2_9SPHN|nr:GGDEF domain-containing protein [Sphingobium algorifonticola]RVT40886.1 GGDEF domain-containing protein [Sphingobium algorifonticola]